VDTGQVIRIGSSTRFVNKYLLAESLHARR
jgi:hypothetical protein